MRKLLILGLLAAWGTLPGSTLRQLTLDDMIRQSTMIVRGTVQPATVQYHGSTIFSHYTVQVTETYKSAASSQTPAASIDFGVPGGSLNGAIQRVAGAPMLTVGQDYVLFLWTSKSGLTQVIGLSQGLFSVISTPARRSYCDAGSCCRTNAEFRRTTGNHKRHQHAVERSQD